MAFIFLYACNESPNSLNQQFKKLPSSATGINFNNIVKEDAHFNHLVWESVFNGSGVAIGDINNDGLPDIYFTGNQVDDALYLNKGDMKFEDITNKAGIETDGWSSGVSMADINGDGNLDIYVSKIWWDLDINDPLKRENKLFINNGDLSFTNKAKELGVNDIGNTTNVAFLDYDLDGDLDIYVLNAPSNNYKQKLVYINANFIPYEFSDKLFRNDGNSFTDVTKDAGVEDYGFGLGVVASDLNGDGWVDLYVANDFEIADRMFINQQDGTFKDEVQRYLKHISYSSMGTDVADLTNDGLSEIGVLDMQAADHYRSKTNMPSMDINQFWKNVARGQHYQYMTNMLQWNRGYGYFSELGQLAGISSTDWSWSILMADYDNDRLKDIFVSNGINRDMRNNDYAELLVQERTKPGFDLEEFAKGVPSQKLSNYMFKNNSNSWHFDKVSKAWGLDDKSFSFGASYSDLDRDGDLDMIVCNSNEPPFIYQNQNLSNGNFVGVNITGLKRNRKAIGAKVHLYSESGLQFIEVSPTRGYQSGIECNAFFGLANDTKIDSLIIEFDLKTYKFETIKLNEWQSISLSEGTVREARLKLKALSFAEIENKLGLDYKHLENKYDDFQKNQLLPHKQSKNGPVLASADVNKDGLEDIVIGASHGEHAKLFLQKIDGTFTIRDLDSDPAKENMGMCFIDFDQDGDEDLYLSNGGSEKSYNHTLFQDELLVNDGRGNYILSSNAIPEIYANGSKLISFDMDEDGDEVIIIGGRGYPNKYPYPGRSMILENVGAKFVDVTDKKAPLWASAGMITDLDTLDYNKDGKTDFIAVGEWMTPTLFVMENGVFEPKKIFKNAEQDYVGWWFSVDASDLNNDGKYEFILGNIGMNNKYHASVANPLFVYSDDFDKNNVNDIVLAKTGINGIIPVRGRECSSEQEPMIKQKFRDFESYATAELSDIYGEDALSAALSYKADEFRSGIFYLQNFTYIFKPFPDDAQIAPIMATTLLDVNQDGSLDVICTGNHYDAEVETTKHDAGNGLVLINKGNQEFDALPSNESGFYTPANAKDMIQIDYQNGRLILVSNNGFILQAFQLN